MIKPGQWFDTGNFIVDRFGGHPKLCTRIGGSRVYFTRWCEDPVHMAEQKQGEYCSKSSIGFVADTREEIQAISELGRAQHDEIMAARKQITDA